MKTFTKMKSCKRMNDVKTQNISSIPQKMRSLERLQSILGQLKINSKRTNRNLKIVLWFLYLGPSPPPKGKNCHKTLQLN